MSRTVRPTAAVLPAWGLAADYVHLVPAAAEPGLFALFADGPFADLENFGEQLAHEKTPVRDVPDFYAGGTVD